MVCNKPHTVVGVHNRRNDFLAARKQKRDRTYLGSY